MKFIASLLVLIFNCIICILAFGSLGTNNTLAEFNYHYDDKVLIARKSEYPVHPLIKSRHSAYEMTGEEMTDDEIYPLFEAARWSPSSYNLQEWRFVYAKRNTSHWDKFYDLLMPYNQKWCTNASVLVVMLSAKYENYKENKTFIPSHSFDAGSAWMALALEGTGRGYAVRAIEGFDYQKTEQLIFQSNNTDYSLEVMIAIGKRPHVHNQNITQRTSIKQFVSEGVLTNKVVVG